MAYVTDLLMEYIRLVSGTFILMSQMLLILTMISMNLLSICHTCKTYISTYLTNIKTHVYQRVILNIK